MAKTNAEIKVSLIDGVSKGLASIQRSVGGVGISLAKAGAAAVTAAAAIGGIAIGAAFVKGVESAAAFEVSLDKISAKTGLTGKALEDLGADIRRIAQDSTKTGAEGALAFEKLTAEGLNASAALEQLPAALDFATASSQGTAEAIGSLADNLDAFGLGADSFGRAADVLTAGALKGGVGVADLQKALQQVGPTARDLGLSLEQTTAQLATLAQNGLEGGRAGKALAAVFDQLRDPSSRFREELAKIGITSGDFNAVLAQLGKGGANTQAALNALGVNGTAAIKALSKDGGVGLAALTASLGAVEGTTAKTAAAINANLTGAFTRFKEAADTARASFLTPILEPLANELDGLTAKINEFVGSPEFEKFRQDFKAAFLEALDAAKKFVAEFDLKGALKSVEDFTTNSAKSISEFKTSLDEIATGIKAVFNGVAAVFNSVQTGVAASVLVVSRSLEKFYGVLGKLSPAAKRASEELKALGDIAENETAVQAAQLGENVDALAGNLKAAADATDTATEAQAKAVPVLQNISKEALIAAQNQKVFADAAKAAGAASAAMADEVTSAATSLGNFGDSAKLAAENAAINAKIAADAKASFADISAGIQAEIDARKQQAGALNEVSAAADDTAASLSAIGDVAGAVSSVGAAVNELTAQLDGTRRSSAEATDEVSGLVTTIANTAQQIALLTNTKPEQVLDGLARSANGAIDPILEMSNQIRSAQRRIEELGGQKALEKLRADAQAAADAFANMEENAASARDEIAGLAEELQNEADQRAGNQEAIEQRRFDEQIKRIEELARAAGRSGENESARARELARKNHEARLAEIRDEAAARVNSEIGADSQIASSRGGQSAGPSSSGGVAAPSTNQAGQGGLNPPPVFNVTINNSALTGEVGLEAVARLIGPVIERIKRRSL